MNKLTAAILCIFVGISAVSAQNYRGDTPNQPNGYRASEAASHYHGKYHEPAQPLNGYHASEFGGHSAGSRTSYSDRFHSSSPQGGGSFRGRAQGLAGTSRWGGMSAGGSSWQGAGQQRSVWGGTQPSTYQSVGADGLLRRAIDRRSGMSGNATAGGANYPSASPAYRSRFANYGPLLGSQMARRENGAQRMVGSGRGGFHTIYEGE